MHTGRVAGVLRNLHIAGHGVPDLEVTIRDVDELRGSNGAYLVDGFLGLDYLLVAFASIMIDTQTLRVTLRPKRVDPSR